MEINDLWAQSPIQPNWYICFDHTDKHFGYFVEKLDSGTFYAHRKLTYEELQKCLTKKELLVYEPIIRLMLVAKDVDKSVSG